MSTRQTVHNVRIRLANLGPMLRDPSSKWLPHPAIIATTIMLLSIVISAVISVALTKGSGDLSFNMWYMCWKHSDDIKSIDDTAAISAFGNCLSWAPFKTRFIVVGLGLILNLAIWQLCTSAARYYLANKVSTFPGAVGMHRGLGKAQYPVAVVMGALVSIYIGGVYQILNS